MLGFTALLFININSCNNSCLRLIWSSGLLVGLQGGRLRGVGEDEVDEDGGEEEQAAHHRKGEGEASNLIESSSDNRSHNLPWKGFTTHQLDSPMPKKSSIIANIEATLSGNSLTIKKIIAVFWSYGLVFQNNHVEHVEIHVE